MKNPNNLLIELAEKAAISGHLLRANRRKEVPGKPGEFFNSLTEEEKEVLRQLKSDDIDVRPDALDGIL